MTKQVGNAYDTPSEKCPWCGTWCDADWVDVGVGMVKCGPYHCQECGGSEIGPHDEHRDLTEAEHKAGWYAPGAEPGSSANVIGGRIVSHNAMAATYRERFYQNPEYDIPGVVEEWWHGIRKRNSA